MRQNKKIIVTIALAWMLITLFFASNQIVHAQSSPTLSFSPSTVTVNSQTENFTLNFKISGVTDLWGWSANITWDSQYIKMVKAPIEGDFLSQSGHQTAFPSTYDKTTNTLKGEVSDVGLDPGAQSGDGTLATFTFQVLKPVVSTTITINATRLLTNQTDGATGTPQYKTPINPFPTATYAFATVSFVPSGGLPVPDAGLNQTVNQHTNVLLNASKTLPQDPTQNYTWTFFDNESRTISGMIANYTFDWPGTFAVTLTVSNSNGTATAVTGINVKGTTPPVAIITIGGYSSGQNIPVNTAITFYSNQSYDPYNLTITHLWDLGDGSPNSPDSYVTHTYSNPGTYNVVLTIRNSAGHNGTATKTVVVGDGISATASPNPDQTNLPSDTSTSSIPSPSNSGTRQSNTQMLLTLPPTMLYTLIFVTAFVLGGAVFWLRKRTSC
jgi:PKD repeat protein